MEIHKKIEDLNVTLLGLDTEKLGALEKIGGKLSLNCTAEYLKLPAGLKNLKVFVHAVKRESNLQPDVVGQHFQSADAEHYVGNRADIFAHCVALHSLELLQNVGTHDNRNSPP